MDLTLLVGNLAIVCTIASNFAALPVCMDMVSKKSTAGVSSLPFLTATVCASLWFQYGIATGDSVLTLVNLIAVFMQTCYLSCFFYSTAQKAIIQRKITSAAVFVVSTYIYSSHVTSMETAIHTLGILASCGSIISSAAPMAGIGKVFQSQSTEALPFLIIFATFIVTMLWYVYGVLIGDNFIKIPNLIGALLSGFQLSLFAIFDPKPPRVSAE